MTYTSLHELNYNCQVTRYAAKTLGAIKVYF